MASPKRKRSISVRQAKKWGLDRESLELRDGHPHRKGFPIDSKELARPARAYLEARGIKSAYWKLANLRVCERTGDLILPYFFPHGTRRDFERTRRFGPGERFRQPKGKVPCLYWPPMRKHKGWPTWKKVHDDVSYSLYVVEGELKAMALAQYGIPALAIGGVDAWRSKGKPIEDWKMLPLSGRSITLAFDADIVEKQPVQRALVQLGTFLAKQGSIVQVLVIPDLGDGVTGVDDFIAARGIARYRKLAKKETKPFGHADFTHWGLAARNDTDWGFGQLLLEHHGAELRYIKAQKGWMLWVDGD